MTNFALFGSKWALKLFMFVVVAMVSESVRMECNVNISVFGHSLLFLARGWSRCALLLSLIV